MTLPLELTTAIEDARRHAEEGRKGRPFDPVYVHTLEQLAIIDRHIRADDFSGLSPGEIDVGLMAVKELGSDEQGFAHALHVIQRYADAVTGENAENR
ncbi:MULTISPECIES: hypothetical protein [Pseudomonadota]|uniref:Uncharacterized protein n=1 Tax=Bordetella petrii (strain ATCC BAA-461 / DSM 12804 / CCUG 43448 / CIP 107267 / Se-1111R) TaxID=340100 RepID=A9IEI6_BORPD|nr:MULTISPECIES: hypothetical protein [Pseudomonadota]CAP41758.1 hypothetical protein predicted by Glimmer/Critica [Bordetella petrii]